VPQLLSVVFALLVLVVAAAAAADESICSNASAAHDDRIDACGKLIASGQLKSPEEYARSYRARGNAYHDRITAQVKAGGGDPIDVDRAIADMNEAIRLNPKDAGTYNDRGFIYYDGLGEFDLAIADFSEAIRLDPNLLKAYYNRGNVHEANGDLAKALSDFRTVLALGPNDESAAESVRRVEQKLASKTEPNPPAQKTGLLRLPSLRAAWVLVIGNNFRNDCVFRDRSWRDRIGDKLATAEEHANRKRRLLEGPTEFRDMRRDHPHKTKG
jgi:tetratricopeptide (TPR) repeat protein